MTPERIRDIFLMFVPLGLGTFLIVYGFIQDNWSMIGLGGGLLGVPGIVEGIKAVPQQTAMDRTVSTNH